MELCLREPELAVRRRLSGPRHCTLLSVHEGRLHVDQGRGSQVLVNGQQPVLLDHGTVRFVATPIRQRDGEVGAGAGVRLK